MTEPLESPADQSARVVVIGAGQAGLSVGYHLRRLGLVPGTDLVLLDRAPSTGGAWQFRWEALRLGAAHRVHDLPGMRAMGLQFDDADRSRPARDVVGSTTGGSSSTTTCGSGVRSRCRQSRAPRTADCASRPVPLTVPRPGSVPTSW
ncbi:NAD(P)-binding protein [Curtobacterium sp. 24E2]